MTVSTCAVEVIGTDVRAVDVQPQRRHIRYDQV